MTSIVIGLREDLVPAGRLEEIAAIMPGAAVTVSDRRACLEAALRDAEIAAGRIPVDLIADAPRLRWFQQWEAGADWLYGYPSVVTSDLVVTTASGVHAVPIAEHVFALLLAFARMLPKSVQAQQRHEWLDREQGRYFELAGGTLLIIGMGAIGRRIAVVARGLGMRVFGVRRNPADEEPAEWTIAGPDQIHRWLPLADAVVLSLPLNDETRNLFGERELRLMKPSAHLVNVGRGATIDEPSLVRALREGWIAGVGLDVFATEPLPPDSPLWDMENVIVTAHYAGSTPAYNERSMAIFLDNLRRYRAGLALRNVVDKQRGY